MEIKGIGSRGQPEETPTNRPASPLPEKNKGFIAKVLGLFQRAPQKNTPSASVPRRQAPRVPPPGFAEELKSKVTGRGQQDPLHQKGKKDLSNLPKLLKKSRLPTASETRSETLKRPSTASQEESGALERASKTSEELESEALIEEVVSEETIRFEPFQEKMIKENLCFPNIQQWANIASRMINTQIASQNPHAHLDRDSPMVNRATAFIEKVKELREIKHQQFRQELQQKLQAGGIRLSLEIERFNKENPLDNILRDLLTSYKQDIEKNENTRMEQQIFDFICFSLGNSIGAKFIDEIHFYSE